MQGALNIAVRAARAAGNIMVRYMDRLDRIKVDTKSDNDFVSDVDRMCEHAIIDNIRQAFPSHAIEAEESGAHEGDEHLWIIDPLDGTTNYLHGFPQFAASIAMQVRGRTELGVIYDPLRQELFVAERGGGARLDERRIRVSARGSLKGALIGTGFPFGETQEMDRYLTVFKQLAVRTAGLRRPGAAALDLAYVGAGRLDGFFEFGLKRWDMAAGALIAREAGAMVADADGSENFMATGNIVVASPRVYREMHTIIGPHFARERVARPGTVTTKERD